jgi:hypothetical protein
MQRANQLELGFASAVNMPLAGGNLCVRRCATLGQHAVSFRQAAEIAIVQCAHFALGAILRDRIIASKPTGRD